MADKPDNLLRVTQNLEGEVFSTQPHKLVHISFECACRQLEEVGYMPSEEEAAEWEQEKKKGAVLRKPLSGRPQRMETGEAAVAQDHNRIPRPSNSFMIYRSAFTRMLRTLTFYDDEGNEGTLKNGLKSLLSGYYWRRLSEEEQKPWADAAVRAKEAHAALYPEYKFRPVKKRSSKKRKRTVAFVSREISLGEPARKGQKRTRRPSSPVNGSDTKTCRNGGNLDIPFLSAPFPVQSRQGSQDHLYIHSPTPAFDHMCAPYLSPLPYQDQHSFSEPLHIQYQHQLVHGVETIESPLARTPPSLGSSFSQVYIPASTYLYACGDISIPQGIYPPPAQSLDDNDRY